MPVANGDPKTVRAEASLARAQPIALEGPNRTNSERSDPTKNPDLRALIW